MADPDGSEFLQRMSGKDPRHPRDDRSATDKLIASQIAYYRAHAPRYDDWWFRRHRHDLGEVFRAQWDSEISAVRAAVDDFAGIHLRPRHTSV
jgi:hypothetical protein